MHRALMRATRYPGRMRSAGFGGGLGMLSASAHTPSNFEVPFLSRSPHAPSLRVAPI